MTVKRGYFAYPGWGTAVKHARQVRSIIRKRKQQGCDFIKTVVPFSDALRRERNISGEILRAIADEARSQGLKVSAHSMWKDGLGTGITCGVDSLEHAPSYVGGIIEERILAEAACREIRFVPTADLLRRNYQMFHDREELLREADYQRNMPAKSLEKMTAGTEAMEKKQHRRPEVQRAFDQLFSGYLHEYQRSFNNAVDAGIQIAAGTDSGANYTPHGIIARELERYVRLGMSPHEAMRTVTVNAAGLLGLDEEIGSLEVGKRADILMVRGGCSEGYHLPPGGGAGDPGRSGEVSTG